MSNFVTWFEIPVTDFNRAVEFYRTVMNTHIETVEYGPMMMSFFDIGKTQRGAFGAIVLGPGYEPSGNGVRIAFSCMDDMQAYLDRVEPAGGKIIQSRTQISEEYGYAARFEDPDGNRIGLHSEK